MQSIAYVPSHAVIQAELRKIFCPKGICCPRCQRRYTRKIQDRFWCKTCRFKFSFKRCLPFAHSKLSSQALWLLLACWIKRVSLQDTEAITGLSHTTIRRWYRRFAALLPREHITLGGTVEVDEAFIGKQRHRNQRIVVGAVERSSGKVVLRPIPNREQESLDPFLLAHVARGSLVCTDAYSAYEHLTEFFGYGHQVVNHSLGHYGITNRVENLWMRLRRFIRKVYHHVWKEHLPRILKEFQARQNHPEAFTSPLAFLRFCVPSQLD